ncbi:MAG: RnfABCDGE type electron transport complex subunit D [Oscillospiraceae bacterium]|nr:RnfABCDGE type electron transport complex subunit D [Oscillospiraceae bacterium]
MNRTVKIQKAPFLRNSGTVQSLMGDMLIVMPFIYLMPIFFYGFRVFKSLIYSLAACYLLDQGCIWLKNKRFDFKDLSSLVTGAILPLLMPASVDFFIILAAAAFAILVVKHPFGGLGNTPFNSAAAAFCFCAVSWPEKIFAYTRPMQWLPVFGSVDKSYRIMETTAQNLKNGGRPLIDAFDILSGNAPGAAGVTCIIVILAAAAYLLYRRAITIQIPAATLLGAGIFALLFPRISTGILDSLWFELTSGALIFGAVFMAPEPSSSPKHPYAKWIYGAAIGIVTMLFRSFGKTQIAFPFALLIVNSFTPFLDKIGTGIDRYTDIPLSLPAFLKKKAEKGGDGNE